MVYLTKGFDETLKKSFDGIFPKGILLIISIITYRWLGFHSGGEYTCPISAFSDGFENTEM
jgi:hypothetical protein